MQLMIGTDDMWDCSSRGYLFKRDLSFFLLISAFLTADSLAFRTIGCRVLNGDLKCQNRNSFEIGCSDYQLHHVVPCVWYDGKNVDADCAVPRGSLDSRNFAVAIG